MTALYITEHMSAGRAIYTPHKTRKAAIAKDGKRITFKGKP